MERNERLKSLVGDRVVIVASWSNPNDTKITIQDFIQNGESFIPVFTSIEKAKEQTKGSDFAKHLVEVKTDFLTSLLKGPEVLIFNPADGAELKITADEFKKIHLK